MGVYEGAKKCAESNLAYQSDGVRMNCRKEEGIRRWAVARLADTKRCEMHQTSIQRRLEDRRRQRRRQRRRRRSSKRRWNEV